MYHVKLQFFGCDPYVPKPLQVGGIIEAHAYFNEAANCHETPPIPAADYERFYRNLPEKWRVVVLVDILAGTLAPEPAGGWPSVPAPFDVTPEPAAPAEPPTDEVNSAEAALETTAPLRFRELRARCKELDIPIPMNATTEDLRKLLEATPAPVDTSTA